MTSEALLQARAILFAPTPLRNDCGRLCDIACCQGEEGDGMYLFPGEAALYRDASWATLTSSRWMVDGVPAPLLSCQGHCPREDRPLACRLFPLTLSVSEAKDGFEVIPDPRAWACCPLMPHGLQGLTKDFVDAVRNAFSILWKDPEQRAFLMALDALLRDLRSM